MPNPTQPDLVGFAASYASGTGIAPHAHDAHQLIHAISGAMRVSAQNMLWILPVGRGLWMPAGVEHAFRCQGNVGLRTAYLSRAYTDLPETPRVISTTPLAREVLVRLSEPDGSALRPALGDILIHEIRHGQPQDICLSLPKDRRIAQMAQALWSDPAATTTLAQWAQTLGFSERSLIRRIRQETGMSFREFRRQSRVMLAMEKLVEGQPVTTVALDVGFETPSAFISAFRLVTGRTPSQFARGN